MNDLLKAVLIGAMTATHALAQGAAGGAPAPTAPVTGDVGPIEIDAEQRAAIACIAAAEKSLRLNQAMELRDWLDAVPESQRSWEWDYLHGVSDTSSHTIDRPAPPTRVSISPDRTRLATVEGNLVHIFALPSMTPVITIDGHSDSVYRAEFGLEGKRLVTVSRDVTSRTWDLATGEEIARIDLDNPAVAAAAFSPDGSAIGTCAWHRDDEGQVHGVVWIWDAATGEVGLKQRVGDKPLSSIQFTPDGRSIVIGSWDGLVHVLDGESHDVRVLTLPDEGVYRAVDDVDVSPDGALVAAASKDQTVRVFDLGTMELVASLRAHLGNVQSVRFSPDGSMIATGSADGLVRTWSTDGWSPGHVLRGHVDTVRSAIWSGDASLISCSFDSTLRWWDLGDAHGEHLPISTGEDGTYTSTFSADGSFVAVACYTSFVVLMDTRTGEQVARWSPHEASVNTLALSADSSRLLTCSWDETAKLYDTRTQELLRTLEAGAGVYDCDISPDATLAALGVGSSVQIWDLTTGERVETLSVEDGVSELRFNADGTILGAAAGNAAYLWRTGDWSSAGVCGTTGRISTLDFGDGVVYTGSPGDGVRAWNLETGACLWRHADRGENGVRLRLSPYGERLALGGNGLTIIDAKTGHVVLRREPLADTIWHVDWSSDGRLAACCWDGTIAVLGR